MILLKVFNNKLLFWGQIGFMFCTLLNFPKLSQQVVPGCNQGMVGSEESFRRELIRLTCKYPPEHGFKGDWGTWRSIPPAMQQSFSKDIYTEEIDSPRLPKVWIWKGKAIEMVLV